MDRFRIGGPEVFLSFFLGWWCLLAHLPLAAGGSQAPANRPAGERVEKDREAAT
jgi:hypothetical protein